MSQIRSIMRRANKAKRVKRLPRHFTPGTKITFSKNRNKAMYVRHR